MQVYCYLIAGAIRHGTLMAYNCKYQRVESIALPKVKQEQRLHGREAMRKLSGDADNGGMFVWEKQVYLDNGNILIASATQPPANKKSATRIFANFRPQN